jgi:hypothetical protein
MGKFKIVPDVGYRACKSLIPVVWVSTVIVTHMNLQQFRCFGKYMECFFMIVSTYPMDVPD